MWFKDVARMWVLIKLDAKNATLLNSCIQFDMFTDISDLLYTKYVTYKNSAKCNLIAINLEIISWKKTKKWVQEPTWKGYMPFLNIYLNKGKYPLYGKELLSVISMWAICHTSKFMQISPNII